jgi:hypothetical protein
MINSYLYITNKTERATTQSVSNIHIKYTNMNTNTNVQEIWKDIPNYEGYYQVSNLGRVKSLERKVKHSKGGVMVRKQKILKVSDNRGYLRCLLCKNKKNKTFRVHQLVAMAFLNHVPCGHKLVVNHINFNRADNRVENLELITNRKNCNQKHLKSSSQYTGVYWNKNNKNWAAGIRFNGKKKYLGSFEDEYDAHLAYQSKLNEING